MITITRDDNTETRNLVIVDTIEAADEFLDRLSGKYWGEPGILASRDHAAHTLTVKHKAAGASTWTVSSIYKAENL